MSEAEVTTLLLRFRDLGIGPGQTVRQHQELIRRLGHAWWAWWNKAGEQVPADLFARLDLMAGSAGLDILLYDSGQSLLFQAKLRSIATRQDSGRLPSPQPDATPPYYRDQEYRAWFRFESLESANPERLRDYTYIEVSSFFESGFSRFGPFDRKRVHDIDELQDQNRTIWFLRPFRAPDKDERISIAEGLRLEPANFPRRFVQTDSTRLLLLSDIHLSRNRGEHGYPLISTATERPLAMALERAVETDKAVGGALISGDLTWRAATEEFALVHEFLGALRSWTGLDAAQVGVIPGNHDLKFSDQPYAKGEPVVHATAEALSAYTGFYRQEFFLAPNQFLSMGRRFLLRNAVAVEVAMLNSSMLQQAARQFQGHGFLGDDQLDAASVEMGWRREAVEPRAYRVAVLHHHLLPMTYRIEPEVDAGYSTVLDAEALMRWLVRHRVDLVVHGHMHQPGIARVVRPIDVRNPGNGSHAFSIVALGSAGVAATHLGETRENTFGILDFATGSPVLSLHAIHPGNPSATLWTVPLPLDT